MPRRNPKGPTDDEIIRWFEAGLTVPQMVEKCKQKYGITYSPSKFYNVRYRYGLPLRNVHDRDLVPWKVKSEHRFARDLQMLRYEGTRRAGGELKPRAKDDLERWLEILAESKAVIHYDPDTEQGFFKIPRERRDKDIVRQPEKPTSRPTYGDA